MAVATIIAAVTNATVTNITMRFFIPSPPPLLTTYSAALSQRW